MGGISERSRISVKIVGDIGKKKKLMKILDKAKVRFTHISTEPDEDGNEFYHVEFTMNERKFWKIRKKIDLLGNLTID